MHVTSFFQRRWAKQNKGVNWLEYFFSNNKYYNNRKVLVLNIGRASFHICCCVPIFLAPMNIKGLHGNGYACCLYTSHVNLNNISIDVYYESSLLSDSSINFPSPCDTPIYLALITCRLFLTGICSAWRASLPSFSSWDLCLCQRARGG